MEWPFPDDPDVLVFTSREVIEKKDWIHYVSHDAEDGAWQFLGYKGSPERESDARLVLLRTMLKHDETLASLADLPIGWIAWRDTAEGPWFRRSQPACPEPRN